MGKVIRSSTRLRERRLGKKKAKRYLIQDDFFNDWHTDFILTAHIMYFTKRVISFAETDVDIVDTLGDPS